MANTREKMMKALPWVLIFGGFYLLNMMPAIVAGGCMVVGITMLLERRWPEKWGEKNK